MSYKNTLIILLGALFMSCNHNPYTNVEWSIDYPGAIDQYQTYTPVLKSDPTVILGSTVGTDFGTLTLKDGDGIKEVIIATDSTFAFGEYYAPEQHVSKSTNTENGIPKFEIISTKELKKFKSLQYTFI